MQHLAASAAYTALRVPKNSRSDSYSLWLDCGGRDRSAMYYSV